MPAFCRPLSAALNTTLAALALALPGLATPAPVPSAPPVVPWDSKTQGGFVMALTGDRQGHIWAGTEDDGIARFDPAGPAGKQWTQFTAKNTGGGLGDDDCYSLVCDRLGRVWIGTLNHGVAVFNGHQWKTYDQMTGPLGCHVVALATSPLDGDVWMATEAGLARYSLAKNTWTYYTRADGLPSDQATCLAFTPTGTLIVGTACDGVVYASPTNDYKTWGGAVGPGVMPAALRGEGLPSSLINCLLVSRSGTVYAGTTTGLAKSRDGGETWRFVRGADWKDKLARQSRPVPPQGGGTGGLLEDYVTALAEDGAGRLCVAHRQKGMEVLDPATGARVDDAKAAYGGYVKALLPTSHGHLLIGTYGDGLRVAACPAPPDPPAAAKLPAAFPPLPAVAQPPTLAQMRAMLADLARVPALPPSAQPTVAALDDDWKTQGTWVDRYGDFAAVLCAMNGGGNDQVRGYRAAWVDHRGWTGRADTDKDFLRYYVTWRHTDDPRSLQNMLYGGRTEAEWDDHGEKKPMSLDGPNVYGTLKVPKGRYVLSCYDFNKDGRSGPNRWRDYLLTVKVTPMTQAQFMVLGSPPGTLGREQEALFDAAAGGASSRVRDFWGGVWKRFYVDLPEDGYVTVKVGRNHSFNTILPGIFLDPVGDLCGPQGPSAQPAIPRQPALILSKVAGSDSADVSLHLMDRLLVLRDAASSWYLLNSRGYLVPLLRRLLYKNASGNSMAAEVDKADDYRGSAPKNVPPAVQELLRPNIVRPDVAACLNDLQMFDRRDDIFYDSNHVASYKWHRLSQYAQQSNWDYRKYASQAQHWDRQEYQHFVQEQENLGW